MNKIPVGIIGVSGYTGLELIKLLLSHPIFEIAYLGGSSEEEIHSIHPSLLGVFSQEVQESDCKSIASRCKLVFLALPHKSAMEYAQKLLELGVKVVDLSADYRLSLENYETNYCPHLDPKNLAHAIYGLPEWNVQQIKQASLVANPGCYPTATLLGILPFISKIDGESIFVDAKSGVSGAGKNPSPTSHYSRINENLFAYSPLNHRHQIEIEEKIQHFGNHSLQVNFVPHLCPFTRGMLVSIYAKLKAPLDPIEVLTQAYDSHPFIRIRSTPPEVKYVSGTHFCDIFAKVLGRDLFISSSIDNLLRGASSQALVNANLMFDLPQELGIPKIAYVP
ncbi:N-acetyl-gamma-glutamyl-phosphate reductase [Helicobacter pametensis]|uniref:N-acetyl-gamma-glutamyl-phosphate reductase n=1 Tax=Helicobacter pametensis TaxID=95149 RepID=UPI000485B265|nr:N-acetyl-gamma-glutamyl-phosphate reductase [Helicobacter pametensis]